MGIRDLFKRPEDKFMRLLVEQAAKTVEGMELLEAFMESNDREVAKRLVQVEKEADMVILEVESNPYLRRMVSLVREAAHEIYMGVLRLQDHPNVANDHAVRAKALENRVEHVYREALAELFHRPVDIDRIMDMLKLREIYRHLSNAADRGDQAANVIGDIVVKMT